MYFIKKNMKKTIIVATIMAIFGASTAFADILPPGQKTVPVCAYFDNINDHAGELVLFGYEESPVSESTVTEYSEGECFTLDYKFNTITIYGVKLEHSSVLNEPGYNPTEDPEAYAATLKPEIGLLYVAEDDTLNEVQNIYSIVELDVEGEELVIEESGTERYYTDKTAPVVLQGEVTLMSGENLDLPVAEQIFTDVAEDSEYYDALVYLKENGKVNGYPDGSFKPYNSINRAEFVKMTVGSVATTQELEDCTSFYVEDGKDMVVLFNDVTYNVAQGGLPEWYFPYVCEAKRLGVVAGYPDGSFLPANNINFVEAAKIIIETIGVTTEESDPWYKKYVDVLDRENAIPVTISLFDQKITRGEMAEIMYRLRADVKDLPSRSYEELN